LLALTGSTDSEHQIAPDRFQVKYHGTFRGHAIQGFVTRTQEDNPTKTRALLSSLDEKKKVLMVLADDGNEIRVMEKPEKGTPRFYTLGRIAR
jgi:hypothetical protein